jgi:hypothetical protein
MGEAGPMVVFLALFGLGVVLILIASTLLRIEERLAEDSDFTIELDDQDQGDCQESQ